MTADVLVRAGLDVGVADLVGDKRVFVKGISIVNSTSAGPRRSVNCSAPALNRSPSAPVPVLGLVGNHIRCVSASI